ncbi:MAG: DUF6125 family protein [Promethearchaeota archaeon]
MSKEKLLDYVELLSKNWLAHDGTWFLGIEEELGIEVAMKYDIKSWKRFTVIEAKRIKKFLNLNEKPGIPGLIKALGYRLYANINIQDVIDITPNSCIFRMRKCRVQTARARKGLSDFPCRPVGDVEYGLFGKTIDSRIQTECLYCPPGKHPSNGFCAWKFIIQ